ncbi:MAG: YidC/Oxa1 family membrane protein insertase [Candidatus Spyradenecus sp.]
MTYLVDFFAWLMAWCHSWCPNVWLDIVLFTFLTKVLQFPVALWCQANSLKMVSLMPECNRIKIEHYGDSDAIGEETAKLFKREHYHPLLSLVPLAIQIVILMAFVKVIYGIGEAQQGSLIGHVPVTHGGWAWSMPLLAGAAAWLLGYAQNRINPLQREQTRLQQAITNGISIAISLFLGCFVAMGVGLYWATSNLLSIPSKPARTSAFAPRATLTTPPCAVPRPNSAALRPNSRPRPAARRPTRRANGPTTSASSRWPTSTWSSTPRAEATTSTSSPPSPGS